MDLENARDLKQRIREAVAPSRLRGPRSPFATGISLTEHPADYRVAILLTSDADRRYLQCPKVRSILQEARGEVDVEVVGVVRAATARSVDESPSRQPLKIGASVGHFAAGDGSLGFFAARRSDGKRGIVSCNHVIALADDGVEGDDVLSPSRLDGGGKPQNTVAALDGTYPRLGGSGRKLADCAFAALKDGIPYDPAQLEGGSLVPAPAEIAKGLEVTKIGRITGARPGVVMKIEIDDVPMRYGAVFDGVILIGSSSPARFCELGDSGALVYTTRTFQPVGLLFATSDIGGPHNAGWTWVNPIRHVTAALDVDLVVT